MKTSFLFLFAIILLSGTPNTWAKGVAKPNSQLFNITVVATGFNVPWGMAFLPNGKMLITQQKGKMSLYDPKTKKSQKVQGLPQVKKKGQGGLMDVVLHPQFKENSWVYFTYVAEYGGGQGTVLARGQLKGAKLNKVESLYKANPPGDGGRHFGSRIVFDNKGFVFFSIGDRGNRDFAQSLKYPFGKVFRLHDDGRVPQDNPFVGRKNADPAIWSYGHRNPQGLAIHPHTGELWEQEHGPRGGDEINIIKKGANYGWPQITYGKEYWGPSIGTTHKKGMEQPVKYFVPSIAPCGLMIYSGKLFKQWKGHLFSGALVLAHLNRVEVKNGKAVAEARLLEDQKERVRNVIEGPEGAIYVATDPGRILKLTPL